MGSYTLGLGDQGIWRRAAEVYLQWGCCALNAVEVPLGFLFGTAGLISTELAGWRTPFCGKRNDGGVMSPYYFYAEGQAVYSAFLARGFGIRGRSDFQCYNGQSMQSDGA